MGLVEAYGWGDLLFVGLMFLLGGFVKGMVGFALPLIAVTGAASILDKNDAVAAIILPVLVSNVAQALRGGVGPLLTTARRFAGLNVILAVMIVAGASALPGVSEAAFFAVIGGVTLFAAATQLLGWRPRIRADREKPAGYVAGGVAGFIGGLSGIWGPPIVLFLNALNISKSEHMRTTGLAFLVGAIVLAPAHLGTGVLNAQTLPLSAALIAPVMLGVYLGRRAEGRLDADAFRKATLIVLTLAALNLLRRALAE